MRYDVIIIGAGPGGIFSAYELTKQAPDLKVAVFEAGHELKRRKCPIDGTKIKSCVGCDSCSVMSGFGGAGAFSDGKYNITNDFGGSLYEYIGKNEANILGKLMKNVVENGTASALNGRGYTVAGKTGSAEFDENGSSHSWFIGYSNVDDPDIAVAVIVENGGTGSEAAVPIAGDIFDAYYFD